MTIKEVAKSLYNLSVDGHFNRESFSLTRLEKVIRTYFNGCTDKSFAVLEMELPDGWWNIRINHYSNRPDGYDYTIPDTREQEQKIIAQLMKRYCEVS